MTSTSGTGRPTTCRDGTAPADLSSKSSKESHRWYRERCLCGLGWRLGEHHNTRGDIITFDPMIWARSYVPQLAACVEVEFILSGGNNNDNDLLVWQ
jgi:hypothetical protein